MISLTFGEVGSLATDTVPSDVLDVVRQTLATLSQTFLAQENAEDRTTAIINGSDGKFERMLLSRLLDLLKTCIPLTSPLTQEEPPRARCLQMCLKGLWYFGRAFNQPGKPVSLPSYICIAFSNPETIRLVREERDFSIRVTGRCAEALVVNKLATDITSRTGPVSAEELACVSAILGAGSHDVELLLSQPDAVPIANMISLTFGEIDNLVTDTVPSDVLDVVRQTLAIFSQAIPVQENAEDRTIAIINGSDGKFEHMLLSRLLELLKTCIPLTPSLTQEERTICLRMCLKGLWHFGRAFNQPGKSLGVPLASDICIAFSNPKMTPLIREERDFSVRVIGRCAGALAVNKLATDIIIRAGPVRAEEQACLSAILGTKSHDVKPLLSHLDAIKFTNIVFLALDNVSPFRSDGVPLDVLDVTKQTFSILTQALPDELNTKMQLDPTSILTGVSGGTSYHTAEMYNNFSRVCLKNLWSFTRTYNGPTGSSLPLPPYVCIAFANPEMARRIRPEGDLAAREIGRCVGALVVNKLATDITSRTGPVSAEELACVSAILGAGSHDVELLLSQPDAVPIANMISLTFGEIDNLVTDTVPSDVLDVVRQTLAIFSQAILVQENAEDRTIAIINGSDGKFEHMLLSRLLELLKTCIPLTPSLTQEERTICLRMCLKGLWHFGRAFNQPGKSLGVPLASDICIAFSNPKMTPLIREERDFSVRVIGRCAGALAVNKLATDIIIRAGPVRAEEQACLSAILGTKSHDVKPLLSHLDAIKFTNIVFLALDNVSPFRSDGVPLDVLDVTKQTFSILTQALPDELNTKMQLDPTSILTGVSGGQDFVSHG
ncbi:hypothetical protein H4582DRAFT_453563 [Lactarius indigo]|nr:hypothetical protein H4582DRAFT_453563 [Lactarius indigo]